MNTVDQTKYTKLPQNEMTDDNNNPLRRQLTGTSVAEAHGFRTPKDVTYVCECVREKVERIMHPFRAPEHSSARSCTGVVCRVRCYKC